MKKILLFLFIILLSYNVFSYDAIPIRNCAELQNATGFNLYYLVNNIDCSGTILWNGGLGFEPLVLQGNLMGNGFNISGLYINRPAEDDVSLIRSIYNPLCVYPYDEFRAGCYKSIRDFSLIDAYIIGRNDVSGVISAVSVRRFYTNIMNIKVINSVIIGNNYVGGVAGYIHDINYHTSGGSSFWYGGLSYLSSINNVVSGNNFVGGVIGYAITDSSRGIIYVSSINNIVSGNFMTGGIIGKSEPFEYSSSPQFNEYTLIDNSYSINSVIIGNNMTGGLSGWGSYMHNVFSNNHVIGNISAGGLVGEECYTHDIIPAGANPILYRGCETHKGYIFDSYFSGEVFANNNAGGIFGAKRTSANSYTKLFSAGAVNGFNKIGFISGENIYLMVSSSIYAFDNLTDTANNCSGGAFLNCTLENESYFKGDVSLRFPMASWNFNIWQETDSYPILKDFSVNDLCWYDPIKWTENRSLQFMSQAGLNSTMLMKMCSRYSSCSDGIMDGQETEIDYGGNKCGYCINDSTKQQDSLWQASKKDIPFDFNQCKQLRGAVSTAFIFIIILLAVLIIIGVIVILFFAFSFSGIIFGFIRVLKELKRRKEDEKKERFK